MTGSMYRQRRVAGAVCARTILYFDPSVDSQAKTAVIQSILAAQAGADQRYDPRRSFAHWYLSLRSRLKDFGWALHSRPKCTPSRPPNPSSTLPILLHELEHSEVPFSTEEMEGIARCVEAVARAGGGEGMSLPGVGMGRAREEWEKGVGMGRREEGRVFQVGCVSVLDTPDTPSAIISLKWLTVLLASPSPRQPVSDPLIHTWGDNSGVRFSIWNDQCQMMRADWVRAGQAEAERATKGAQGALFSVSLDRGY